MKNGRRERRDRPGKICPVRVRDILRAMATVAHQDEVPFFSRLAGMAWRIPGSSRRGQKTLKALLQEADRIVRRRERRTAARGTGGGHFSYGR